MLVKGVQNLEFYNDSICFQSGFPIHDMVQRQPHLNIIADFK